MTQCTEVAIVRAEILSRLDAMRADWPEDDQWRCDFDDDHQGEEHWTIGVYGGEYGQTDDLWVRWRRGQPAALVEHPGCEAIPPSGDDSGLYCLWVDGHPGQHSTGDERW